MKLEFESLSKSYDALHHKSQEIIRTLQKERDEKIIECEGLKSQVWMCVALRRSTREDPVHIVCVRMCWISRP